MRFINPVTITDARLISSNGLETPPAAWSGATTYAAGDTVATGTAGGTISVWESLQSANINHDPTTDTGIWWLLLGTTYAAWNGAVTYAVDARVLSATTHRVYQSVQAGNVGHDPLTDDGTWWVNVAPTDRWAMFDQTVGTATRRASPLVVELAPGAIASLALLDVVAGSVRVVMTDAPGGTVVFDQTYAMSDLDPPVIDWWTYFTAQATQRTTLIVAGLPYHPSGRVTVTLTGTTVECGTLVAGLSVSVGRTLAQPQIGIIDYSRKTTDPYGITSVVERAYAKRIEAQLLLAAADVDYVARKLAAIRATPVVWIGDETGGYESLTAYGWVRDWGITIAYPDHSEARLQIEGLV